MSVSDHLIRKKTKQGYFENHKFIVTAEKPRKLEPNSIVI